MGRNKNPSKASKKTVQRLSYERSADQPIAITPIEYTGLQEAYDHFNVDLFAGYARRRVHHLPAAGAFGRLFLARPVLRSGRSIW